jgi:hypothetical protein
LETLEQVRRAVIDCADAPLWSMSDTDLIAGIDAVHATEQALTAVKLHLIRQLDTRDVPATDHAHTCAGWLHTRLRLRPESTKRLVGLAKAVDQRPNLDQALTAGTVNAEQAHVIDDCLRNLPTDVGTEAADKAEAILIGWATDVDAKGLKLLGDRILAHVAPELADAADEKALRRQERDAYAARRLVLSSHGDGKVHLRGILDTEAAAIVAAALDPLCSPRHAARTLRDVHPHDRQPSPAGLPTAAPHDTWPDITTHLNRDPATTDPRSYPQQRADALVEICRLVLNTGDLPDNGGHRPQLTITIGFEQLRNQTGAATLDTGQHLSATQVRRLACDAQILPATLNTDSQILDVGRTRRLITGPLRSALVLRDKGCAFPGCDRPPRWADGHHIISWIDGGPTNLNNSVLLCRSHHQLIHTGDWQIRLGGDGFPDFIPPAHLDPTQRPRRNLYHRRT